MKKPTDASNIADFTAQDGTGATGEMGKGSEGLGASGDNENNGRSSCEAHYVAIGPQEDRSVPASEMGKDRAATEKGCVIGSKPRR